MIDKKKSVAGIAVPTAEKENLYVNKIISEKAEKIKCPLTVHKRTDISELTKYQHSIIGAIYRHSHNNLAGLIDDLSKLEFCNVQTAVKSLVMQNYINEQDEKFIIGRIK